MAETPPELLREACQDIAARATNAGLCGEEIAEVVRRQIVAGELELIRIESGEIVLRVANGTRERREET